MRVILIGWVCLIACVAPQGRPFDGKLPQDTYLDVTGKVTLSPNGELRLALAKPCTVERNNLRGTEPISSSCKPSVLSQISVIAHSPWGQETRGIWDGAAFIRFPVNWKSTDLDPLDDRVAELIAQPWGISGTQWSPSAGDAAMMRKLIAAAAGVETEVSYGGPTPSLEVTGFEIEGGTLHAGEPSTLVVRIANRGPGTAYRVVASTRSSIDVLHGQRLSFGAIKPGEDKLKKIELTVPASETAHDTMLVLAVSGANGGEPRNASRRISIAPSSAAPVLSVHCVVEGKNGARPDLDAGERLPLSCTVDNTGNADAKQVGLEVVIGGEAPTKTALQSVTMSKHLTFNVSINVPRSLPIDAPVEISITARDRSSSSTAHTTVTGVVRKPRLCIQGQLTRPQYQAKINDLRAAVTTGDLTQGQFDRYDAELVACFK